MRSVGHWLNPTPAKRAEKTNHAAYSDPPWPAKMTTDPWRHYRRDHAADITTRIANRRGSATLISADINRGCPKRPLTRADRTMSERKPQDDPRRLARKDAKGEK